MTMQRDEYDEEDNRGFWARMKDRVLGVDSVESDPGATTIRLGPGQGVRVDVRLNASVFNDARIAADGLKEGKQQIVNLEKATPAMAERILDFLSGVAYALDGSVDRIGEKVYLFVPAGVEVDLDGGSEPRTEI